METLGGLFSRGFFFNDSFSFYFGSGSVWRFPLTRGNKVISLYKYYAVLANFSKSMEIITWEKPQIFARVQPQDIVRLWVKIA